MIRSMTGYGRKEAKVAAGSITVEIRSVNNRYLDIQIKAPRDLSPLEPRIKKAAQERFARGRFDIFIFRNGGEEKAKRLMLDEGMAERFIAILRDLKERFSLPGEVELSMVAAMQDIITVAEVSEDAETAWALLSGALSDAMDGLEQMRMDEGEELTKDIIRRLDYIEKLISEISLRAPLALDNARKRMTETLGRLLAEPPDPARVSQEIAVLAEKTDVTEELTRLNSHLKQFRSMLDAPGKGEAVGRKLDFLLQEMGREVNTLSAKAQDAGVSLGVVSIKAELEKIREQAQNIE